MFFLTGSNISSILKCFRAARLMRRLCNNSVMSALRRESPLTRRRPTSTHLIEKALCFCFASFISSVVKPKCSLMRMSHAKVNDSYEKINYCWIIYQVAVHNMPSGSLLWRAKMFRPERYHICGLEVCNFVWFPARYNFRSLTVVLWTFTDANF